MARAVPTGRQRQRVMKNSMESLAVRELLLYVPKGGGGWHGWRAGSRWEPQEKGGSVLVKEVYMQLGSDGTAGARPTEGSSSFPGNARAWTRGSL